MGNEGVIKEKVSLILDTFAGLQYTHSSTGATAFEYVGIDFFPLNIGKAGAK